MTARMWRISLVRAKSEEQVQHGENITALSLKALAEDHPEDFARLLKMVAEAM